MKSFLPTIWVRPTTLTSTYSTQRRSKVRSCHIYWCQKHALTSLPVCGAEFKDDSIIIPRSSSVVVKRLPSARPGKGKASMYVNGAAPSVPSSEPVLRGGPAGAGPVWHKGAMSKRFDGKDETPATAAPMTKPSTPVSLWSEHTQQASYVR